MLLSNLTCDPTSLEEAHVSLIAFNDSARQVVPQKVPFEFKLPQLNTGGTFELAKALRFLKNCMAREKLRQDAGYYKSVVFLFTDNHYSADEQEIYREAKEIRRSAEIVLFSTESFADPVLKKIASRLHTKENVVWLHLPWHTAPLSVFLPDVGEFNPPPSANKISLNKGEVIMSNYVRRLPVYLLVDCSGSMMGEPIEAVNQGINMLLNELRGDPQALETAYLSVIKFDSTAQQIVPLTELMSFNPPQLSASGMTALGEALHVLKNCVATELRQNTAEQKGDWKPLVFVLTDGYPTDDSVFEREVQDLSSLKAANIIACAAGPDANAACLKQITPNVLQMNTVSPGNMAKFFKWASSSIKTASASVSEKPGEAFATPPPPQGFTVVP